MIKNLSHIFCDININYSTVYSADLPLSRQRLESGKSAEYTRRIINIYITKKSCVKFFLYRNENVIYLVITNLQGSIFL